MTTPPRSTTPRPIAALPMYDWPDLTAAHDSLWTLIRDGLSAEGIAAPQTLDRGIGLWEAWDSPDLLLGQTCGMPYRTRLHGRITLVGTLDYGIEGAPPGFYRSVLVTRRGDSTDFAGYRDRSLAFNGQDSQSGWAAPQNHAAEHGFRFTHTLHTGAHRASARAVAEGRADIAAIDAVTWRILARALPEVVGALQVIGSTAPTPGLPLITAQGRDPAPLAAATAAAVERLAPEHRQQLGLCGFAMVPASAYLAVPTPAPPTQDTPANC
ncbi:phosphate/phosphite/phosphonate ABC transporter substrate-binding protein [Frigidibacter sp. ROC022]|uniref:phosphate/phosphite/phosphonate ABC transporter substrate-binding protein n=1 Tax=Frigidibacter sp. ROC022 TaxID=2971796 RepID=UPI00215B2830|nr:phosphate/phosphite/phosphonate ABC transporter substrate-binding protein [Frigidibacter sp. ROC022]MCR8723070.1 phosphate/phosphite/phosphonate ABC transporter substrate-binding protein [Frigidibacter sp. ROC022]